MANAALAHAGDGSEPINTSTNLNSFTPFPKLPIELRLNIFGHAMPGARRVHITLNASNEPRSATTIPALLHVCKESRQEALKVYEPLLDPTQPIIFFSFELDVLHLCPKEETTIPLYSQSATAKFIPPDVPTIMERIERIAKGFLNFIPHNKSQRLLEFSILDSNTDVVLYLNQEAPPFEKDVLDWTIVFRKRRFDGLQFEEQGWQILHIRVLL